MEEDLRAKEFGPKLKALRSRSSTTLLKIAKALHVSESLVSKWESGDLFPTQRNYAEHYADQLQGGQELLDDYDRLAVLPKNGRLPDREKTGDDLIVGGDYEINRYEKTLIFPDSPGGYMKETEFRELTALRNGLRSWKGSTAAYGDDGTTNSITLISGTGSLRTILNEPLRNTSLPGRLYVTEYSFAEELSLGERASFSTLKSSPMDFSEMTREGSATWFGVPAIKTPVEHMTIAVCFPQSHRPKLVWYFEEMPELLAPGRRDPNKTLKISGGCVSFSWQHIRKGYSYGLVWSW